MLVIEGAYLAITYSKDISEIFKDALQPHILFNNIIGALFFVSLITIIRFSANKYEIKDNYILSLVFPTIIYMLLKFSGPLNLFDAMSYKIFISNISHDLKNFILIIIYMLIFNLLYFVFDIEEKRVSKAKL